MRRSPDIWALQSQGKLAARNARARVPSQRFATSCPGGAGHPASTSGLAKRTEMNHVRVVRDRFSAASGAHPVRIPLGCRSTARDAHLDERPVLSPELRIGVRVEPMQPVKKVGARPGHPGAMCLNPMAAPPVDAAIDSRQPPRADGPWRPPRINLPHASRAWVGNCRQRGRDIYGHDSGYRNATLENNAQQVWESAHVSASPGNHNASPIPIWLSGACQERVKNWETWHRAEETLDGLPGAPCPYL